MQSDHPTSAEGQGSRAALPGGEPRDGGPGDQLPPSSPVAVASTSKSSSLSSTPPEAGCVFAHRVLRLPAVQALMRAYDAGKMYPCVGWFLTVGERAAVRAVIFAALACKPLAEVCRAPKNCADWCLCKALDGVEVLFPFLTMPPGHVCHLAKKRVANCICCPVRTTAKCLSTVCPSSPSS